MYHDIWILPMLGRILVGFFFAFFGVTNFTQWRNIRDFMQQNRIPLAVPSLFLGIAWQFIFGIMLIFNIYPKLAALCLIPFTIIAVFIFHAFWKFEGEVRRLNMILFVANLTSALGALLLLMNTLEPLASFKFILS